MKKAVILFLLFIQFHKSSYAQSALTISSGSGFTKIFTSTPKNLIGFSGFLALGLEPKSPTKRLKLLPAIEFRTNNYSSLIDENIRFNINQITAGMRFMVGFPFSEYWNLKAGLFANFNTINNVFISYDSPQGGVSSFSNQELAKFYYPTKFQSGFALAINRSVDKAKKYSIEFIVQQNANSILQKEFSYALFNQVPRLLFRQKSLPTSFCIAVNAKLTKGD